MDRETERAAARAAREKLEAEAALQTSLYTECTRYAECVEGGERMLLYALLFSEPWSRPPAEEIVAHDALLVWDQGMHHKTIGEHAIARAYKMMGDTARCSFHARKAELAYPGVFWNSDAYLDHVAVELQRAKLAAKN